MPDVPVSTGPDGRDEEDLGLEWLKLERAQLAFDRRKELESRSYLHRHPGVLITGAVSLAAVVVSALGLLADRLDQGRLIRLQFSQYVSENYAAIFSDDPVQRTRLRMAMEFAFPQELTDSLLSYVDELLVTGVLAPMITQLNRSKAAFDRYGGNNRYLEVEVMREANVTVRDLLVRNAGIIPANYQPDAQALIDHYDVWLEEFERVRGDTIPDEQQPFVFAGPRGSPFPRSAERRFRELYADLQMQVLEVDAAVARAAAGIDP